jgi:hypothetical protein
MIFGSTQTGLGCVTCIIGQTEPGPCYEIDVVSLGFVEGINNRIPVIQRRTCGIRDEE